MVNALAKLHNFCIDEVDGTDSDEIGDLLYQDLVHIEGIEGGFVDLTINAEAEHVLGSTVTTPDRLIGGGGHFDDVP